MVIFDSREGVEFFFYLCRDDGDVKGDEGVGIGELEDREIL